VSAKIRERYAVLLVPEGVTCGSFGAESQPDPGVTTGWVDSGNSRALVLRYAAGNGENLPQAKAVKSLMAARAQSRGLKKTRLLVLDSLDEVEIERQLRARNCTGKRSWKRHRAGPSRGVPGGTHPGRP